MNKLHLSEMITFWELSNILIKQDTTANVDYIRVHINNHAITIAYRKDSLNMPSDVLSMAIYKGTSWMKRDPVFKTTDNASAMYKLREFF